MSKQSRRRQHRPSARGAAATPAAFTPVPVRFRHDGWTPARQIAFVHALAATANVEEACRAVGMSPHSFYDLRRRPDAGSFRQAVQAALDVGVERLADAMLGRALHGVATPIFYKGEQVGERRRYDERLGMFLLRARAPERYGKWRDQMQHTRRNPDGAALMLRDATRALAEDVTADSAGRPRPERAPLRMFRMMDDPDEIAADEEERARIAQAEAEAKMAAHLASLDEELAELDAANEPADRPGPAAPVTQADVPELPARATPADSAGTRPAPLAGQAAPPPRVTAWGPGAPF